MTKKIDLETVDWGLDYTSLKSMHAKTLKFIPFYLQSRTIIGLSIAQSCKPYYFLIFKFIYYLLYQFYKQNSNLQKNHTFLGMRDQTKCHY